MNLISWNRGSSSGRLWNCGLTDKLPRIGIVARREAKSAGCLRGAVRNFRFFLGLDTLKSRKGPSKKNDYDWMYGNRMVGQDLTVF